MACFGWIISCWGDGLLVYHSSQPSWSFLVHIVLENNASLVVYGWFQSCVSTYLSAFFVKCVFVFFSFPCFCLVNFVNVAKATKKPRDCRNLFKGLKGESHQHHTNIIQLQERKNGAIWATASDFLHWWFVSSCPTSQVGLFVVAFCWFQQTERHLQFPRCEETMTMTYLKGIPFIGMFATVANVLHGSYLREVTEHLPSVKQMLRPSRCWANLLSHVVASNHRFVWRLSEWVFSLFLFGFIPSQECAMYTSFRYMNIKYIT